MKQNPTGPAGGTQIPDRHLPDGHIPDDRVAGILARAAELDRDRRESISVDAIRAAALDAGISRAAVDTALAEYAGGTMAAPAEDVHAEPDPDVDRPRRFARARRVIGALMAPLRTPLKLGALLFVLGLAGAAGEAGFVLGLAAWGVLAVRLMLKHRPARTITPYVLALVYMTFGLATGYAAAEVDEDVIAVLVALSVPLLVLGSLFIKVRLRGRSRARSRAGELEAQAR